MKLNDRIEIDCKFNDKLEIHWLDIVDDPRWLTYEEAMSVPIEVYCKSVGYFFHQDETFVWLSSTIGRKKKAERSRVIIPKGTITEYKILQVRRKK